MLTLNHNGTSELNYLPLRNKLIICLWIYVIKVVANGHTDRLKSQLVAKGYSKIYELDYIYTFSLVTKIMYVWSFIDIGSILCWPLYYLDIWNFLFFHGELEYEIYMEKSHGFVASGESGWYANYNNLFMDWNSTWAWLGNSF